MKQVICGLLTFVALVLDCSFMTIVMPFGIHPSLMLCIVIAFGIVDAPFTGAMAGLFGGLMMDIMFGNTLGFYGLIFLVTGYAASAVYLHFFSENTLFSAVCIAGAFLGKELLSYLFALVMGAKTESIFLLLLRYIIPSAAITGALGLPLYSLVHWLSGRGFMQVSKYKSLDL